MADNVAITAGSGTTIKTDDISGAHYQVIKLADGTADATAVIAADIGVKANALRVAPASDITDGTYIGDIKFGEALPAGTNAIGKLAANDGVDIGDVSVNNTVTVSATQLDIDSLDKDDDEVLVWANTAKDGTGTDYVPLVDTDGHLQVDVLSAASTAVTNAGTFVVQEDGAALTALQLIDDSIFADDAAFTLASSKVTMSGAIRDDSLSTLTAIEGDAVPLRVSSTGALHVTGGGGGTEYTEDSATPATITGTATLIERDDALSTVTPIEGDWIGLRGTAEGALWVQDFNSDAILADTANMDTNLGTIAGAVSGSEMQVDVVAALPAGTNAIGKLAANSGVDIGDVDILSVTPGTGASNLGKAEDAAHTTGDVGVMALAVRQDSQADFGADGDYVPFSIDANGALRVAGGGGGTEYTEDDAAPTNPVGKAFLAQRDDALGGLTPIEGDWTHLFTDANGALWTHDDALDAVISGSEMQVDVVGALPAGDNNIGNVDIASSVALDVSAATVTVDNGGTFATQVDGAALTALQLIDDAVYADDADWTDGTSKHFLVGGLYQSSPQTVTDGDVAPFQIDSNGNLIESNSAAILADTANMDTNLGTIAGAVSGSEMQVDVVAALPAGTNAIGKLAANSGVDIGDVDVTSVVPGTGASNLGKAEDAAHSSGDVGVMSLGVRDTSPAAVSGTDGDYEPLHVSDDGGLWVTQTPSHTGGNSGFTSIDLDESEEEVSGTACTVSYMYFWNATAAPLWVQLFDATAASVTVGTTAPTFNFPIPANADSDVAGMVIPVPNGGLGFGTALSVAVTTGSGTNNGAPGANEAGGFIVYKN
jgi:hypothetical protein